MNEDLVIQFMDINSWINYSRKIKRISSAMKDPIFRGQGNKFLMPGSSGDGWRLKPTLYRMPNKSHPDFVEGIKSILKDDSFKNFTERIIGRRLEASNNQDRHILVGLMRHVGHPTPILDWTKNPYIASYFAFKYVSPHAKKVTIFLFDKDSWLENTNSLTSRDLDIVELVELNPIIPRQKAQESIYTYSKNEEVYAELLGDSFEANEHFITYCRLPVSDREKALEDLRKMGISHKKLFPDEREIEDLKKQFKLFL